MRTLILLSVALLGYAIAIPTPNVREMTQYCESLLLEPKEEGGYIENGWEYFIDQSRNDDGTYNVRVRGLTGFWSLSGFIIQARHADNPDYYETYGTFTKVGTYLQANNCQSTNDTASHNPEYEEMYITWHDLIWTPPPATNNTTLVFM